MLYVLLGEDDFSRRQSLREIRGSIGDETVLAANTTVLDGQQLTLDQLRNACETVPFLADRRLVIVEGLLGRFEAAGKASRKPPRPASQRGDYPALADYLHQIPDFTVLVLMDGRISSRNPLLREAASAKAEIRAFPLLKGDRLRRWIRRRVGEGGGSISPGAVALLERYIGSNLWVMANEIDKLVLFTQGRSIEEADVKQVVSYVQEASVFALVDAILGFRTGAAQTLLEQLLHQGATPTYLLAVLLHQARMLVRVKELRSQRKSSVEIGERLGIASEFLWQRVSQQADRYSLPRLKEMYHQLLEADLAIKTGKRDGELALTILIAELGQPGSIAIH